ncbi:unnamed protein product [Meganyctiphanes norvegica]|uniref:Uncharacterized protein n=1 Tax=Meganyctiphanes norvegica TaxID=48144 RepID=A0AAV2PM01_MEGNR
MFVDVLVLLTFAMVQILPLDQVILAATIPNRNVTIVALEVNDILAANGDSQIPKEHFEYCSKSKPQERHVKVRELLSPKGLATNREQFSHLLDGNYEFYPAHIPVKRCDRECSNIGREDVDAKCMVCTFIPGKVQHEIIAYKEGQTIQFTLVVDEDRDCICNAPGINPRNQSNSGESKVRFDYMMYTIPIIIALFR